MNKRMNQRGIDLIKECEGFSNIAYKDGGGVWTIGYGFTEGVKPGDIITKEQGEKRLKVELLKYEQCINESVHRDLTDNQFAACVILAYNIGRKAFIGSTLCRLLNKHEAPEKCAEQFLRWNIDNGKVVPGLTNRRKKEKELFLS